MPCSSFMCDFLTCHGLWASGPVVSANFRRWRRWMCWSYWRTCLSIRCAARSFRSTAELYILYGKPLPSIAIHCHPHCWTCWTVWSCFVSICFLCYRTLQTNLDDVRMTGSWVRIIWLIEVLQNSMNNHHQPKMVDFRSYRQDMKAWRQMNQESNATGSYILY